MNREIELLIKLDTLKTVEIWLNEQYVEIQKELIQIKGENNE